MALVCPACRVDMTPTPYMGIALDVCPQCAGIWFDDGELSALVKSSPDTMETLEDRYVPELEIISNSGNFKHCPRCDAKLETHRYAYDQPAKVDSCPSCHGVFVEDTELAAIHRAVSDKYRYNLTGVMKARRDLTGEMVSTIGEKDGETSVSALVQALSHWRDRKATKA